MEVIIAPNVTRKRAPAGRQTERARAGLRPVATRGGADFKRQRRAAGVAIAIPGMVTAADLRVVSERQLTEQELRDALFCWKVAKFVKPNGPSFMQCTT